MSTVPMVGLSVAAVWLAVGLTLSLVMGRRGHDAFSWLILGTLFGPLGAVFAFEARSEERRRPELVAGRMSLGSGPVDVLVGFDGSPEAEAAAAVATELLGARVGRLPLATVLPYDCGFEAERAARAGLERQAAAMGRGPRLEILRGRPSRALLERAAEDGYDLVVIGARGSGATKALLGSTATDVARSAPVPVLLTGQRRVEAAAALGPSLLTRRRR